MSYISLITGVYSRKIVGYGVADNLKAEPIIRAYKMALKQRIQSTKFHHHSDRGIQYCSGAYQKVHEQYNVICSMTDSGNCYQNALAERMNGILKRGFLILKPHNLAMAKTMVQ